MIKNISNFNKGKMIFALALMTLLSLFAVCHAELIPAIEIRPGANVEVGEEVFFSGSGTTYTDAGILKLARYEWDFGDGYYYRFDPKVTTITRSGIACVHYFMKPGTFTVTLKVSVWASWDSNGNPVGTPLEVKTVSSVIQVTGEAPMAGFEIQRAPFHGRLAQYLYVQIPSAYRGNQTTLRVMLTGVKGYQLILFQKNNLSAEEKVFLDHKPLPQDNYVVTAELFDSGNSRISGGIWRDKFTKGYSGTIPAGIDENNSFRLNGQLFFPIMTFMTNTSQFVSYISQSGVNSMHTEGFYNVHNPASWGDFLDNAANSSLVGLGPGRGSYEVAPAPNRWKFNHNPDTMRTYVQANKNKSAMFTWLWQDEPNLGGRSQKVYPPTLAAWNYIAQEEDPSHLSYNSYYGLDWSRYYVTQPNEYDYVSSANFLGGKKWLQDIFGLDAYPIASRLHPTLNFTDMGPYAAYLDLLDRAKTNNKNLVPIIPTINPSNRNPNETLLIHSSEQVYLEGWLNVIHGAKGIIWFPYFDLPSIRWGAMKKFADQMKVLSPAVLQPEPSRTITDTADTALNRVDTMIREYNGKIYVIAVRVTEPDPIAGAKYLGVEPDSIAVNFTISGLIGNDVAAVMDENRQIQVADGRFTDTFGKNAVHIYMISSGTALSPPKAFRKMN